MSLGFTKKSSRPLPLVKLIKRMNKWVEIIRCGVEQCVHGSCGNQKPLSKVTRQGSVEGFTEKAMLDFSLNG